MQRVITAIEAQKHFNSLMEQVARKGETLVVASEDKHQIVMLPYEEYQRLIAEEKKRKGEESLKQIAELADGIRSDRGGKSIDPSIIDEIFWQMREERSEELMRACVPGYYTDSETK